MPAKPFVRWIAVAMLSVPAAAFAQGTEQQREACTPDAFRLCGQFIPDAGKVEACLRNAGPRLSPACRVVFYPPPSSAAPQDRMQHERAPPPREEDRDDDD